MNWRQVRARRLRRSGLLGDPPAGVTAVARAMVGVHAQVMTAAEISLAVRMPDATCADVRAALWEQRGLVKTYGPRGTVHLLPAADLPRWCGALAAVPSASSLSNALLTPDQTDAVVAALAAALTESEQPLSMDELGAAVTHRCGAWAADPVVPAFQGAWPRWRRAIPTAAHRGALVFGRPRGRAVTFTSPHDWCPDFEVVDAEEALRWLLRSYLHTYGPSRPRDYARWVAAPPAWANEQFQTAADLVAATEQDRPTSTDLGGLRLLPYFDHYVVAGQPRELLFPGRAAERALRQGQAGNCPVLLRDGEVAGVWHRKAGGRRAIVTVEPLDDLPPGGHHELEREIERLAYVTETATDLIVGPVAVGPHA